MATPPHAHDAPREARRASDHPRCAWCGVRIRFAPFSVEDDTGETRTYHEDCYRYGMMLEPEEIGWMPAMRRRPPPPSVS